MLCLEIFIDIKLKVILKYEHKILFRHVLWHICIVKIWVRNIYNWVSTRLRQKAKLMKFQIDKIFTSRFSFLKKIRYNSLTVRLIVCTRFIYLIDIHYRHRTYKKYTINNFFEPKQKHYKYLIMPTNTNQPSLIFPIPFVWFVDMVVMDVPEVILRIKALMSAGRPFMHTTG